ncbi:E3 ubiquitin- ligase MIB2 isoform X2 [Brachionus plicatilis]|uniref:RING-type E3 ubiquitin transferase n=1 Tax=Brachionus plicatilis TaxID=10195 RepID=A0A3M7SNH8_BRAPC|nr:E3 ubiquitin- ligase MIB2 isoform X2 [Brachionus plicatilis]
MEVGLRVVRGPDWQWGDQDDGEGHVGTIVEIGRQGSRTSPEKTVIVQWDSGSRTNYRVGHQGKYDLRIFDNSTIEFSGVRHSNVICDNCKKRGIQGVRWKCTKCFDFDLCTHCYMADKHDLTHQFMRFETSTSQGYLVTKRSGSVKITAKGIFSGATVIRGPDWEWQNQDGGPGKTGKVIDMRGWDRESFFSVASIEWSTTGISNVYRIGHKGKIDVKYVHEADGGCYYRDHLIVLGAPNDPFSIEPSGLNACNSSLSTKAIEMVNENDDASQGIMNIKSLQNGENSDHRIKNLKKQNSQPEICSMFSVGDKVKIDVSLETFRQMQEGHGGWNQKMADLIGKTGVIHRVTDKGDVRVQFDTPENRWTIYPALLTKISTGFVLGDYVRVNNDEETVKNMQKGHGEWSEKMRMILGKICKIINIYADGDLRISYNGVAFTVNSACCSIVTKPQADIHNTIAYHNMEEATLRLQIESQLKDMTDDNTKIFNPESIDQLVREAAHGNLQAVKDIITKNPNLIDQKSSCKTAIQVSSHQGHVDIVKFLIQSKANLEIVDSEGDTALHFSCFGNQPDITELLLQKNANINSINKNGCTGLHVAVNKQHINCVRVLLKYKCDVNIQDSYGDTALHDIISKEITKESKIIIDMLLATPSINLSLRNKRGFNILQYASLKGNDIAVEKLISYSPQLVDTKKDDGFSAFHLAALNGHKEVIKCLIESRADKEVLNNRRQTPLLLSVAQLHPSIIELLVDKKANVNAVDEDGDSCLHLALNDKLANLDPSAQIPNPSTKFTNADTDLKDCNNMLMIAQNMPSEFSNNIRLIIATYLIQNGAKIVKNKHQISPLDYLTDQKMVAFIQQNFLALETPDTLVAEICKLCDEEPRTVTFMPCQHKIVCLQCSIRMKKCVECNVPIKEKLNGNGSSINSNKDEFNELLDKIRYLEEAQTCSICMERKKDTAFQCGHIVCNLCSIPLKTCHICREKIIFVVYFVIIKKIRSNSILIVTSD